jgi:hypothetical protein
MTTTGSAHTLPASKRAPHPSEEEGADEEEEDQDFSETPRGPHAPGDDVARAGHPSDSGSDSEDDEADVALAKDSEPVDEEELAALKRDAEEQQSGLGGQELGRGKRRRREGPADDTIET